jgi:hypothetical protein
MKSWPLIVASPPSLPLYTVYCWQPAHHNSSMVKSHCQILMVASLLTDSSSHMSTQWASYRPPQIMLNNVVQAKLHTHSIMTSNMLSKFIWPLSPRPVSFSLYICTIMASQVQLDTYSIIASKCNSGFTWSLWSSAPRIALSTRLHHIPIDHVAMDSIMHMQLHGYMDT